MIESMEKQQQQKIHRQFVNEAMQRIEKPRKMA